MNRIAIIGISGSGKSTVSKLVENKTGLPLYHMDQLFWKGNWEAIPEEEYLIKHEELIKKDTWIIEGYVDGLMAERLKRADLIIYLDYSGLLCSWRVIRRWFKHRKESRPELDKDALERFSLDFLKVVFKRKEREPIEEALKGISQEHVVRVYSPKELKKIFRN